MVTYYSGVFIVICWAIFALVWLIAAFATKRTKVRASWGWTLVLFAVIAGFNVLVRLDIFSFLTHAILWQHTIPSDLLGAVITLAGLLGLLWARAALGGNWSSAVVIKENQQLIERGPYRWVRHPIYSGLFVMAIGGAIWYGQVIVFVAAVLVLIYFWYKSQEEERLLTKYFPEEYPSYRARVKALIPFVL